MSENMDERGRTRNARRMLKSVRGLVVPYFKSEERKKAWGYLLLLLLLLCAVSYVNVVISYIGAKFMTAVSNKDSAAFFGHLPKYVLGFVVATLLAVFYRYTEERLALEWRTWMTGHLLKKYFFARAYYNLRMRSEVDNPDQRIAEDVKNFTATALSLFLIALNSLITLVAFMGVLASISSTLALVVLAYSIIGTVGTIYIGKRLVRIHSRQYQREANFRYGLVRVRDNAESIAFFRGEARERLDLAQRFKSLVRNTQYLIGWNRNLGMFTTGYNFLSILVPTIIVAPLYFKNQVEFGQITQAGGAFATVLAALSVIITQFERLSAFGAGVQRLEGLWNILNARNLNEEDDDPEVVVEEGERLKLKNLSVSPPRSSRVLVKDLSLVLKKGAALLIMGASGTGKSSILRTIAGLWNSGTGTIERPRLRQMVFLPQKPYMPIGSLRAQLMYPSRETNEHDERMREILKKVNLESILERVNGNLSSVLDWGNILSLGEQQRVSFARLFFQDPELAFLDEATSALDEENEALLYAAAREAGITLVSVGHRSTLQDYHDRVLTLGKDGTWEIASTAANS